MQNRSGRLRSRSADPHADGPDRLAGRAAQDLRAALGERGATKLSADLPVGVPMSVSSTTCAPGVDCAPVSSSSVKIRTGMVTGGRPGRPTTAALVSLEIVPSV